MDKETLEEAAKEFYPPTTTDLICSPKLVRDAFISGAKWQQERSFSNEEVYKLTLDALDLGMKIRQNQLNGYSEKSGKELHKEWFEQFKKK